MQAIATGKRAPASVRGITPSIPRAGSEKRNPCETVIRSTATALDGHGSRFMILKPMPLL